MIILSRYCSSLAAHSLVVLVIKMAKTLVSLQMPSIPNTPCPMTTNLSLLAQMVYLSLFPTRRRQVSLAFMAILPRRAALLLASPTSVGLSVRSVRMISLQLLASSVRISKVWQQELVVIVLLKHMCMTEKNGMVVLRMQLFT